jgi:dienelactone hydrolase
MTDWDLDEPVVIAAGPVLLDADLHVPQRVSGLVIFAHGSGSSRMSRRNRSVAGVLEGAGFATLLLDLLTTEEEAVDRMSAQHRFDIPMLGRRVVAAIDWAREQPELRDLPVGLFGASTGAAAALIAAAERPSAARAVVSRGGRPDLAGAALPRVVAPVLLIVGSLDDEVIEMNRDAMRQLPAPVELALVPGARHLFEEAGTLATAASLAASWFRRHLAGHSGREREIPAREWGGLLDAPSER